MKIFCGRPSQKFCHYMMELHEHCCEMESMMVFCSLSPFMSSSILFYFADQSVFWIFRFVLMKSVSFNVFKAFGSSKSRISRFLDCFNMLRVVS